MQVPSFDNKVAMTMIQQELGRPWQEVYSQLTPKPIAAASLGQVYLQLCKRLWDDPCNAPMTVPHFMSVVACAYWFLLVVCA